MVRVISCELLFQHCNICALQELFRNTWGWISFVKAKEPKLNCSHSGDKTNVRCWFDATDRAATAASEKKNLLAELFPTMWKQTEATLRWCVGELARGRRRERERERALYGFTLTERARERELSLHSPLWMQHVFQLNIPLCPCSFSAAVYEPFSDTPISACQHWRTNRLRFQTHTHTHARIHLNATLQYTAEEKESK